MSNFKPVVVNNENRATGWARIEVYGDQDSQDYGRTLIGEARKALGAMLVMQGVPQRQVDDPDSGGGFYHNWAVLPDGSRCHSLTNDGHDTLRIYPNPKAVAEFKKKPREDDFDPGAYLWVGIRVKAGTVYPWFALDFALLEPTNTQQGAPAGRGMVGAEFTGIGTWTVGIRGDFSGAKGAFVLEEGGDSDGKNADELAQHMYDVWHGDSADPFSSTMIVGDHKFECYCDNIEDVVNTNTVYSATDVCFTRNGLFAMGFDDSASVWGPFDPKLNDKENKGSARDFGGRQDSFFSAPEYSFGWDYVCWLDPFAAKVAGEGLSHMVDNRKNTLAMQKFLQDNEYTTKGRKQVLDGQYLLVVRAYDTPVHLQSSRQGESIPGTAGADLGEPYNHRSPSCDYEEYMQSTSDHTPLEVEVEVRIGRNIITQREPFTDSDYEQKVGLPAKTFKFLLTCQKYDERFSVVYPHGCLNTYDACASDNGPNMGGPSYSEVVGIDVKNKTAEIVGGIEVMAPFFGDATYHAPVDEQRRTPVFFIGTAFPVPGSQADWESKAGTALFDGAEAVTSGVYGCADIKEITEAQAQAMFAGTDPTHIWAWFPQNGHTLVDMGVPPGSSADWTYHQPPFDATNFYWYYTLALPYVNACYRTYGVVVTSVGGFYEMTQNWVGVTGYTSPDCCTA